MALTYRPLNAGHVKFLDPVDVQTEEYKALLTDEGLALLERCRGLSAWDGSRCVGMAGINYVWLDRAEAWIVLGKTRGTVEALGIMHEAVPVMREFVDSHPARRVEMAIKTTNRPGQKFAKLLGFGNPATGKAGEPEAKLHMYHPDGSDMYMYARLRP